MFIGSREPWRKETGNLLTPAHSVCLSKHIQTQSNVGMCTQSAHNCKRRERLKRHKILAYAQVHMYAHVHANTRSEAEREGEIPVQQEIFCIIHEGENIQIIMSFCFCAKHSFCGSYSTTRERGSDSGV